MTINNIISNNIILNQSRHGIYLHLSSNSLVKGNNIASNGEYGLYFFYSSNSIIINNNFTNDGILITGFQLSVGNLF
jgi:parallel beta-helix repeat protein